MILPQCLWIRWYKPGSPPTYCDHVDAKSALEYLRQGFRPALLTNRQFRRDRTGECVESELDK